MIEADKGGLYRSDDGGESWTLATDDHDIRQRAWYFSDDHCRSDQRRTSSIAPHVRMQKSIDGGKTFKTVKGPTTAIITTCGSIRRTRGG